MLRTVLALLTVATFAAAQPVRYAVYLEDPPADARMEGRQQSMARDLAAQGFHITGAASALLNAIFVTADADRIDEMRAVSGVAGVVALLPHRRSLNKAVQLVNGPGTAAFNAAGALPNGGQGVKIAILDTGIDQNHPSIRDSGLAPPAGFAPACDAQKPWACSNPDFTNGKVIVARSYVVPLAAGSDAANPARDSRPDDYSPRDRDGHGTAVATVAAGAPSTGAITISGMAPKAWLGNYKIFGSPVVNDVTYGDIEILALEDAIRDGMDIVAYSSGNFAHTGPADSGAACGLAPGLACDPAAAAFEKAAQQGLIIVSAAGNDGYSGYLSSGNSPTFNTIHSPGNGPSLITVGGITNSHAMGAAVRLSGANAVFALAGDSLGNTVASSAPLADVAQLGNDGFACQALRAGSLSGKFALIQQTAPPQGACTFQAKLTNATNAGASGAVFYDYPSDPDWPFHPDGLTAFLQPAVIVSNADGLAIKSYLAGQSGAIATLDPFGLELDVLNTAGKPWNQLVGYSSAGPAAGSNGLKPDVLAVAAGSNNTDDSGFYSDLLYMGAQTYDPLGGQFSPTGYAAASGTSFAAPMVAGAAAIIKQNRPTWTAAQIKSAIVNTAAQDVTTDDFGLPINILQSGSGKMAVDLALRTNITVEPASISWGALRAGALPLKQTLKITNTGTAALNLSLGISGGTAGAGTTLTLDNNRLTLAARSSGTVTVTLAGNVPTTAGVYDGAVSISGGVVPLRVPYMFLAPDGQPADLLATGDADASTGQSLNVYFRVTDAKGLAISGSPVSFQAAPAIPVTLSAVSGTTDAWGWAQATVTMGSQTGRWAVSGCLGTCSGGNLFQYKFSGSVNAAPSISAAGVVNAGSGIGGVAVAPGSYIAIYGNNLAQTSAATTTARLPLTLAGALVSFDVPSAGLSLPAHFTYAGPAQINVQVPWELQGQTQVQIKTTFGASGYSNVVTVPVADAAPAFFEIASTTVAAVDPANFANPVITSANPARRGRVISLYANALGPLNNQPQSGEPAGVSSLAATKNTPVVTIGDQPALVSFSGLTPGLPGLYQINVTVPTGIAPGNQPVTLSIAGKTARPSAIAIQ